MGDSFLFHELKEVKTLDANDTVMLVDQWASGAADSELLSMT